MTRPSAFPRHALDVRVRKLVSIKGLQQTTGQAMEPGKESGAARHRASVADFLAQKAIAVVGVTRGREGVATGIYKKLRDAGYTVYAVNPHATAFDGQVCYPSVRAVPDPLDGVVIVTRPDVTELVVDDCIARGVRRIWIHNMLGAHVRFGRGISRTISSASETAISRAEAEGIDVIAGGCPMQHIPPVDPFHRCVYWAAERLGNY